MRVALALLLLYPSAITALPAPGYPPIAPPPHSTTRGVSAPELYPVHWLVRWGVQFVIDYLLGRALDAAIDRTAAAERLGAGADEAEWLASNAGLSPAEREQLRETAALLRVAQRDIADLRRSQAEIRAEMRRRFRDIENRLQRLDARLQVLQRRIERIEDEQRRQYLTLIEHDGRIRRVEQSDREQWHRISDLEAVVYPDPDRFLRYDAWIGGGALIGGGFEGGAGRPGMEAVFQYNFSRYFGMFVSGSYIPIAPEVSQSSPRIWSTVAGAIGGTASLLPPDQPFSVQLAVGAGLMNARLYEMEPEGSYFVVSGTPLAEASAPALFTRLDVGIAPVRFPFEAFVSGGTLTTPAEITGSQTGPQSRLGAGLWFASVGVRMRYDLRGR